MFAKLGVLWLETKNSLWLLPAVLTLAAAALAAITVQADQSLVPESLPGPFGIFGGGADGAREVLSSIAGSIITVTAVAFSVTTISLQLASSQFTPRVLRNFMADLANQVTLGVFIATFTYSLIVLRSVRSATQDGSAFVPHLSVTVAILLALTSIGFLIFFIDHTARLIQSATIISRAAEDALHRVGNLFPEPIGRPAETAPEDLETPPSQPIRIAASSGGYVQKVDEDALLNAAQKSQLVIKMEPLVGEFVLPGAPLALVWPLDTWEEGVAQDIQRTFVIGPRRSLEQDIEFGITQLVDIAVKALSPGVNDLTTAKMSIDRLAEILATAGNRAMPETVRRDESGRLLLIARRTSFDRLVSLAFDDIRHSGISTPTIAVHLLRVLGGLSALVDNRRREPVIRQASLVVEAAKKKIEFKPDWARVEEAGNWLASQHNGDEQEPLAG